MGGKGPDTHETVQRSEPPSYVVPYIQHALGQGRQLYENQPLYAQESVPAAAQEGYAGAMDVARNPMLTGPATGYAQDVLEGEYLQADPLRRAARAELDDVVGGVLGGFEGAGRTGSGLAANALGRGITSALGSAYGGERGLQQQMAMGAPMLEAARAGPSQQLINLGMGQAAAENMYYQEPWDRLGRYTQLALGGAPASIAGGTTYGQQPVYQPSPFSQLLGVGMTGLGLAGGLGWRPFG